MKEQPVTGEVRPMKLSTAIKAAFLLPILLLSCTPSLVAPGFCQSAAPAAKATLLEFSRPGCPICAKMEKTIREVAARHPHRLEFRLLHIDRYEHLFKQYRVTIVPTLIILNPAGQEVYRRETPISLAQLLQKLTALGLIPPEGEP
jgi:hypothetical protein